MPFDEECIGTHTSKRKAKCSCCHRVMRVARTVADGPLCGRCYLELCAPRLECAKCGKLRPINAWRNGNPFCSSCGKPTEICSQCGRPRPVKARNSGKPVCASCHRRHRLKTDDQFRLRARLSARLYHALRSQGLRKRGSMTKEYGIDMNSIVNALGPRPTQNHDVDHVVPLCAFDLDDPEQVRLAFLPQNLRWLEHTENQEKSSKRQAGDMSRLVLAVCEGI